MRKYFKLRTHLEDSKWEMQLGTSWVPDFIKTYLNVFYNPKKQVSQSLGVKKFLCTRGGAIFVFNVF